MTAVSHPLTPNLPLFPIRHTQQNNLDPEKFLRAPRSVIEHTLAYIEEKFGSIEAYLDTIGFTADKRARLKAALLEEGK